MYCPNCNRTLSGKDAVCICRRKRNADELFQKDKRFIVETKEPEKEKIENEQETTKIPNAKRAYRGYGKGEFVPKTDKFSD